MSVFWTGATVAASDKEQRPRASGVHYNKYEA
jgi:hypothetical protein